MKALRSERARRILKDPENRKILSNAMLRAGYGVGNAVSVIVHPVMDNGQRGQPEKINVYFVPKAG